MNYQYEPAGHVLHSETQVCHQAFHNFLSWPALFFLLLPGLSSPLQMSQAHFLDDDPQFENHGSKAGSGKFVAEVRLQPGTCQFILLDTAPYHFPYSHRVELLSTFLPVHFSVSLASFGYCRAGGIWGHARTIYAHRGRLSSRLRYQ